MARRDNGMGEEGPGIEGLQRGPELLLLGAGDRGDLADGGQLEIERHQALAGGGGGVLDHDLDGFERAPAGLAKLVATGQGASRRSAVAAMALPEGVALSNRSFVRAIRASWLFPV